MGYNKIISYGNFIEIYEYERDIVRVGRRKHHHKCTVDCFNKSVGTHGEDSLSKRNSKNALGRRPDNARRASLDFRRVVAANLTRPERPVLVTLTYGENQCDLTTGYRHFSTYIQTLRYRYGKTFKYICVPEFQKRGAVHFHALFWGIPEEVFLSERETRTLAGLWGHGFVYLKQTDGNEKLSFYLTKYMAKAFIDPRLKNQKSYVASRNVLRPLIHKGMSSLWPILDDYDLEENPIVDRSYDTRHLGKGRFRLFKLRTDL